MQNNLPKKPFIRTLALTSLLLPVLHLSQGLAHAANSNTDNLSTTSSNVNSSNDISSQAGVVAAPASEAKQELMTKLGKLAFFSADFSQQILNEQGELLQQGSGSLAISKPNLVNWKTITPDETLIISDGNTLWFYDPFIEQASAYSLAKSIHNTPILLLTSDEPQLWQQYDVVQENVSQEDTSEKASRFVVTPKDKNSQVKQLTLSFSNEQDGQLTEFSFQDATGQVSQISLNSFNSNVKPEASLFKFTLPQGVRLEDKR